MDFRIKNLSIILLGYCLNLVPGQNLLISTDESSLNFAKVIFKQALLEGVNPDIQLNTHDLESFFLKNANFNQLSYLSPMEINKYKYTDAFLSINNLTSKKLIGDAKKNYNIYKSYCLDQIEGILNYREDIGNIKWVNTYYPNKENAKALNLSIEETKMFLTKSMLLDRENPLNQWINLREYNNKLIKLLRNKNTLHFQGPDLDLKLSVRKRIWVNSYGENNFPNGEVFTSPIEDSINGFIHISQPFIYRNIEISGIELYFENGRVIKAKSKKGNIFLQALLNADKGSSYIGEVAFGTNPGIPFLTKRIFFNEKKYGTFHIALGNSYQCCGGNNSSSIHLDLVYDLNNSSTITADEEIIFKDNNFIL